MNNTRLILFTIILISLTGCRPDSLTRWDKKEDAPPTEVITEDQTASSIYLAHENSALGYYMHRSNFNASNLSCEISPTNLRDGDSDLGASTNLSSSDILCWMEAEELLLYLNGATVKFVVPEGLCDYVSYQGFHFYQYQYFRTTNDLLDGDNNNAISKTIIVDTSASCPADLTGITGAPAAGTYITASTNEELCKYPYGADYTDSDGPNCNDGSYIYITPTCTDTDSDGIPDAYTASIPSLHDCGGNKNECITGAGKDSGVVDTNGNIQEELYPASSGLTLTKTLPAPVSKTHLSGTTFMTNRYIANYTHLFALNTVFYDDDALVNYPKYYETSDSSALAGYLRDQTVSDPLKGYVQPFYTFKCLNEALETKGRIRLQIREWNKNFTAVSSEMIQTTGANMNASGDENSGVGCYDDYGSWDVSNGDDSDCLPSGTRLSTGTNSTDDNFSFPAGAL